MHAHPNASTPNVSALPKLLVILGPTAIGKTSLSLDVAEQFNGEIVSADSRLFYRGMDIGTAKPSAAEQARAPHHLIDIVSPSETMTLGQYQTLCYETIDAIHARECLPILVGGTAQYVQAVVEGWGIPRVAPQLELRAELEAESSETLHDRLKQLDPAAALKIHPNNKRRLIRALEVCMVTGRPITELQAKRPPPYDMLLLGLSGDRSWLYERVDRRVDMMIEEGFVQELEQLRAAGFGRGLSAMSALGYRQLWPYLVGECTLDEAVERIKYETHRFVRHQATWFRRNEHIRWVEVDTADYPQSAIKMIQTWLENP